MHTWPTEARRSLQKPLDFADELTRARPSESGEADGRGSIRRECEHAQRRHVGSVKDGSGGGGGDGLLLLLEEGKRPYHPCLMRQREECGQCEVGHHPRSQACTGADDVGVQE